MTLIGYSIDGPDNDSHMCSSCDKVFEGMVGLRVCSKCGYRTDFGYTNPDYRLTRKDYDFSATYDGATIVSLRFAEFCRRHLYRNLIFRPLPKTPHFFHLLCTKIVRFDARKRSTRFEAFCSQCGFYESVTGAHPAFLQRKTPLPDGFFRSDLLFASGNEKSPIIFVGAATLDKLKREHFKGLEWKEVCAS